MVNGLDPVDMDPALGVARAAGILGRGIEGSLRFSHIRVQCEGRTGSPTPSLIRLGVIPKEVVHPGLL